MLSHLDGVPFDYDASMLSSPGIVAFALAAMVAGAALEVCAFVVLREAKSSRPEAGFRRGCSGALMGGLFALVGALLIVFGINFVGYEGN